MMAKANGVITKLQKKLKTEDMKAVIQNKGNDKNSKSIFTSQQQMT